jgi:cysteine synthase
MGAKNIFDAIGHTPLIKLGKLAERRDNVVTVLPDSGDRYFTEEHYVT